MARSSSAGSHGDDDRLGPAIERALPARQRHLQGQHFTRADVSDLISALCIRSADDRVLDPACGTGSILLRARARLRWLGAPLDNASAQLTGVELDAAIADAARENLPASRVRTADFLTPGDNTLTTAAFFDAIVGNPPYVRQELITPGHKDTPPAAVPFRLSRRADLHVRFWPSAMALLREGGRLGFLTSNTWLDAEYGEPLRNWLGTSFSIVAVIESEVETWFDDARVRTLITVVQKSDPATAPHARMVRLTSRLDEIVGPEIEGHERLARFDQLARDIERGKNQERGEDGKHASFARSRAATAATLTTHRWGATLRLPDIYFEILARAGDRLVPLGDLADVSWGIKTGDDALFFVRAREAPPVEPRFLTPVVFNLMELDQVIVTLDQLRRRLLHVDLRTEDDPWRQRAPLLYRYLETAQHERAIHLRPTCLARDRAGAQPRRWFELRPGPPGAILWSIMHQYRHLVPLNPAGFPANDNLLLIKPRHGIDPRLLAAMLNSHVQALIKQAFGRHRNEGMLKTQGADVKRMLVPDPRRVTTTAARCVLGAFDSIAARKVGRIPEECGQPDRRELDEAVCALLGYGADAAPLVARLHAALTSACGRERAWEVDAVSRRLRRPRAEAPRSTNAPAD